MEIIVIKIAELALFLTALETSKSTNVSRSQ